MTVSPRPTPADPDDLLVGAAEIGKFFGADQRRAFYLLQTRQVPAFKIGRLWHARRSTLLKFTEDQEQARAPASIAADRD